MNTNLFRIYFIGFLSLWASASFSQEKEFAVSLFEQYKEFKEPSIKSRRFTHQDIQPLIENFKTNGNFIIKKVGESIEGRDIQLISLGTGGIDVFLWSQMHGDESTATMAIFDIFNFFASDNFQTEKKELLSKLKLHFLPMLNPDGAQVFQRRNALGIDVNRDAVRLQSPEGRILKRIRDSLNADFGFNLHDQSKYYNAENTAKPATISFLAPAYNYEKGVNQVRGNAMKLIVSMNRDLQKFIPGQVAKYNDDFEPRAFGDNIQKWGTSAILIESGGYLNDPEKQEIRKLNFVAILSALNSISKGYYQEENIEDYQRIPENDSKLFDLKLTGLEYSLLGQDYLLDVGINHQEISIPGGGFYLRGNIADLGDLSTNFGYTGDNFSGFRITLGKVYPQVYNSIDEVERLDLRSVLSEGYSYVKVRDLPENHHHINFPLNVVGINFKGPSKVTVGSNPNFFLSKDGQLRFAVINGFLVDLEKPDNESVPNSLIIR